MEQNSFGESHRTGCMGINPRSTEPIEIANLALFLASDKASFINGTVVTADGGWTAY